MSVTMHISRRCRSSRERTTDRQQRRLRQLLRARFGDPAPALTAETIHLELLAHRDHLFAAYRRLAADGGEAAGPDGRTTLNMSRRAAGNLCGELSREILAGTYRPGPSRQVCIPRPGRSPRILRIRNLRDRIVSRTVHDFLAPLWDARFVPQSFAFRPGRGPHAMLAQIVATLEQQPESVLVTADIVGAFDNVQIADALASHAALLAENPDAPRLLALIRDILTGADPQRTAGIDQGDACSPLTLNAVLHRSYDVQTRPDNPHWWRFADDYVAIAPSASVGRSWLYELQRRLSTIGLHLHPATWLRNQDDVVEILGFRIQRRIGGVAVTLGTESLQQLESALQTATTAENPPLAARRALEGWLEYQGPAHENCGSWLTDVAHTMRRCGFRESGTRAEWEATLQRAATRWQRRLEAAQGR